MVEETYRQACRMGAPRAVALCRNFGGALDFQLGRWRESEAELREAVDLYRKAGSASGEALSLQRLGVLLTARGRLDEGAAVLGEGMAAAEHASMRSHCLTRLFASLARNRLAARDLAAAVEAIAEGQETARRHGHCVTCNALLHPEAVRVALATGALEEAERLVRELEATAGKFESHAWNAMARLARGRVEAAKGRTLEAASAFREAREAYERSGAPYEAARCLVALAGAVNGDDAEAAERLRAEAGRVFEELGSPGIET